MVRSCGALTAQENSTRRCRHSRSQETKAAIKEILIDSTVFIYFANNSSEICSPQFSTKWGPIISQHVDV